MKTVLFAWELGGGLGHIGRMLPLAQSLADRGHRVVFVLRELGQSAPIFANRPFMVLQAPIWLGQLRNLPNSATYAEILFRQGFLAPEQLAGLVRSWRHLMDLVRPDLMIADYAPTALLAARALAFPVATYGSGFFAPPRTSPIPPFRTWEPIAATRVVESERTALGSINRVQEMLGGKPLDRLADLFDVAENFLCTVPELDHYPQRQDARYWNPVFGDIQGAPAQWPAGEGRRVYAYLKPEHPGTTLLLDLLRAGNFRSLVYYPRVGTAPMPHGDAKNMVLSSRPLDITSLVKEADLAICHAGVDTVYKCLLAGVPQLCLPMHAEQYITAMNVERLGAGINIPADFKAPRFERALDKLANDPGPRLGAEAFAKKYADQNPDADLAALVERCEELLR